MSIFILHKDKIFYFYSNYIMLRKSLLTMENGGRRRENGAREKVSRGAGEKGETVIGNR